jgi:hypothetical protein
LERDAACCLPLLPSKAYGKRPQKVLEHKTQDGLLRIVHSRKSYLPLKGMSQGFFPLSGMLSFFVEPSVQLTLSGSFLTYQHLF